jgi:hypothetical protein
LPTAGHDPRTIDQTLSKISRNCPPIRRTYSVCRFRLIMSNRGATTSAFRSREHRSGALGSVDLEHSCRLWRRCGGCPIHEPGLLLLVRRLVAQDRWTIAQTVLKIARNCP